ncbi:TonB-dependent receptor [Hippea jasoniae]|uniref:TonB-dependent receptor n=1 Tax=Hippea jasoniae TaxID=944479 RepID=UPI000551EBD7|nr:TonB-dependent receptor [Hippea jasoniae]
MNRLLVIFLTIIVCITFISTKAFSIPYITRLLQEYSYKADLSEQTKKESAGYVIIFTRQDLDKMKIKSLSELINKIPFMIYGENELGLSVVDFTPYDFDSFNPVVVYINDREIITPFGSNGFQLLGQLDTEYIDHIEVYLGMPSFEIGLNSAYIVIKIYTKKGYRENATISGTMAGSYGTYESYIYTGGTENSTSYFLYGNYKNLKRRKYHHNKSSLSKNKQTGNIYTEIDSGNIRAEMNILFGKFNDFMGSSAEITPLKNKVYVSYIYGGLYYKNNKQNIKAHINYQRIYSKANEQSKGPTYFFGQLQKGIAPFNHYKNYMRQSSITTFFQKGFNSKNNLFIVGSRIKVNHLKFIKLTNEYGNLPAADFNTQYTYTLFSEERYQLNQSNIALLSFKQNWALNNGGVADYSLQSGRIGYIYNGNKYGFKSFLFAGKFLPPANILYYQKLLTDKQLKSQKIMVTSAKIKIKTENATYGLLYSLLFAKDFVYLNRLKGYFENEPKTETIHALSFTSTYFFNPFSKMEDGIWIYRLIGRGNTLSRYTVTGGYITLFNTIGKFDLYNSISFQHGHPYYKSGFTYDCTITYSPNRDLSIYLKGINILGRSPKINYIRINPYTGQKNFLNNVSSFDRTIWVGIEYKF